jgi:hypothetical protein
MRRHRGGQRAGDIAEPAGLDQRDGFGCYRKNA